MSSTIEHLDRTHGTSQFRAADPVRIYWIIFAWLMALLALTVIASLIPFDRMYPGLNMLVALIIAVIKAALVVLYFMHVRQGSKLTWTFATAAFLWLAILIAMTLNDYLFRAAIPTGNRLTPTANRDTSAVEFTTLKAREGAYKPAR